MGDFGRRGTDTGGFIVKTFAAVVIACLASSHAGAATRAIDATVTSDGGTFSAPIFTFLNTSNAGIRITDAGFAGGAPWDFIYVGSPGTLYEILDPAGGARTLTLGQESPVDTNDGCTPGIGYSLTSFDPGDAFRFSADPETPGCGSAVIDVRPFLVAGQISVTAAFSDGTTLTGSSWNLELIDADGDPNSAGNQRYRLQLSSMSAAIPEPASWTLLIGGFGLVGGAMRRRNRPRAA